MFAAKAIDLNGRTASKSRHRARAASPPATSCATRTLDPDITARDITKAGRLDGPPPPGRWELAFDRIEAWELDPLEAGLANEISVRGNRLTVYAPIQSSPFANGQSTTTAYRHNNLGGTDCTPAGPFGTYRWSRSSSRLTLTALNDACPNRQAIWNGVWTRVSPQIPATFKPERN